MILEHEPIQVRPYRPPGPKRPRKRPGRPRFRGVAAALLALAVGGAWYATERLHLIGFDVNPTSATVRVEGPHLRLGGQALLWRGRHAAQARAEGYHPRKIEFEAGPEAPRTVTVRLEPLPGRLRVSTRPPVEGEIWIDDKRIGAIGAIAEGVPVGRHVVEVRARGFERKRQAVEIEGRDRLLEVEVEVVKLVDPARLAIASAPAGADLLIDGAWRGRAPKQLILEPGAEVEVAVLLPGHAPYRKTLRLKSGKQRVEARLAPLTGRVELWPTPANATVKVDGEIRTQRQLQLPQRAHVIEVSAPEHLSQKYVVVPHPGAVQQVFASLQSQAQAERGRRAKYERDLKLSFVAFRPRESFEIATTRRRIPVRLTRPFAIMDREVSNELYRRYKADHDSGEVLGNRLDGPNQPVVRVGWAEAALFANWLSGQAGVAPFYRVRDGKVEGFDAGATGYRLPSEAEWAWLTRAATRYAWGDFLPPPSRFGNLADASAADLVQPVLAGYDDGHAVSAEVGSFRPSARGLYDLPGNVAEWMHDVFLEKLRISAQAEPERVNPLGDARGQHHVIRGFGWRDSRRKALSLGNRRYDRDGRDDVGFRLAYYLDAP